MPEAWVGCAVEQARYEWEFIGQDVVISPLGEFRCWAGSTVAFVQVAVSRHVFKVFDEHSVEATFRSITANALA